MNNYRCGYSATTSVKSTQTGKSVVHTPFPEYQPHSSPEPAIVSPISEFTRVSVTIMSILLTFNTIIDTIISIMLDFVTAPDLQKQLANAVRERRRKRKWSRQKLADRSTVPASTIKKFETTGQISLRQFILLWQCVDSLDRLAQLTKTPTPTPSSIKEVLEQ